MSYENLPDLLMATVLVQQLWSPSLHSAMQSLPPELWFLISASVPRRDLPSLARVSSGFLEIARKELYLHVALHNNEIPSHQTLNLLLTNHGITQSIETLHLTSYGSQTLNWIPIDVMKGMPNLRSLTLISNPFTTDEDESNFFETVREFCPLLREFSYHAAGIAVSQRRMALISGGLQRLTWGVQSKMYYH
ncbi:hypothetical protein B0H34DRAFT_538884 [Crassisporium funariophilum]|nr:hypothetical protein B0H34DRAFT_538884 [Crassisporium funariophilum]